MAKRRLTIGERIGRRWDWPLIGAVLADPGQRTAIVTWSALAGRAAGSVEELEALIAELICRGFVRRQRGSRLARVSIPPAGYVSCCQAA